MKPLGSNSWRLFYQAMEDVCSVCKRLMIVGDIGVSYVSNGVVLHEDYCLKCWNSKDTESREKAAAKALKTKKDKLKLIEERKAPEKLAERIAVRV